MKKTLLLLFATVTFAGNAQKNNEFKLDILDILALKTLDLTLEHQLNPEASIGIGLLFNFENEASGFRYNEEFMLSPFYRQHLFQSGNIRYFGEFFGALNKGENNEENDGENNYTDFAFGLGFGGKYIADNGFLVDFHVGIGRNLFNTDQSPEVVPRVGIAIGKRF